MSSSRANQRLQILFAAALLAAMTAQSALAQLQIVAPSPGTSVTPGQSVTITVAPSAASSVYVLTEDPLPAVQTASVPNQFTLTIPASFTPGTYHLTAVGVAAGSAVESDPVPLSIERTADPVVIHVEPASIRFRNVGDQIPLRVVGSYADGTQTAVTASSRTSYASSDTTVATVSASGVVTAVGPGKTSIKVNCPTASASVPIKVQALPPDALFLNGGRFRVDVTYSTGSASGKGTPVQLTSDTGYFWFFSPSNVEIVIKVLNGCSLGGHYWVFAGGLTNVATQIVVTDTQSNVSKTYNTSQGPAFTPIQDTNAFATCPPPEALPPGPGVPTRKETARSWEEPRGGSSVPL